MNSLNHVATGAVLALAIDKPLIVLPLALVSHFVLDVIPHFGYAGEEGYAEAFRHKLSYVSLLIDIVGIVILITLLGSGNWFAIIAGIVALSPDIMWLYRYFLFKRRGKSPPNWWIARFHLRIQWCEREWGLLIEIVYSIAILLSVRSLV